MNKVLCGNRPVKPLMLGTFYILFNHIWENCGGKKEATFQSSSEFLCYSPAVRVSSGCVPQSEKSVVNERKQQAPLAAVKQ